jgi:hypothetical protein
MARSNRSTIAVFSPLFRKAKNSRSLLVSAFLVVLSAQAALAGQVKLAWNASSGSGVSGYKIYYGARTGSYDKSVDAGSNTSVTVNNLSDGATYYFAAKAYDASGQESGFSNEVSSTTGTNAGTGGATGSPGVVAGGSTGDGDVNGDGMITVADALATLRIASGLDALTPTSTTHGDVAPLSGGKPTQDGRITVADALLILQKSVGLATW